MYSKHLLIIFINTIKLYFDLYLLSEYPES
jgi:hypothetical protein